jgi:ankyrin repeat protein
VAVVTHTLKCELLMTTPTNNATHCFNLTLMPVVHGDVSDMPRQSPPIVMKLPPPQIRFELLFEQLFGADDDDELQAHDESQEYLPSDFMNLFDANDSDRPERLSAWLKHLPPLARELYELTVADIPVDMKLSRAQQAVESGMDIHAIDPVYGRSVLHWAAMLAHPDLVTWLLRNGAVTHLEHEDQQGYSVLGCVHAFRVIAGVAHVIDTLLIAGASLDTLAYEGGELLYRKDLTVPLVEKLLRLGADVNGGGAYASTPLLSGCGSVDWGAASVLLDFGADLHRRGAFGTSVLHNPQIPVWLAEQFYRRGADVNATDLLDDTPLMLARAQGNGPLVRWLIAKGAHDTQELGLAEPQHDDTDCGDER